MGKDTEPSYVMASGAVFIALCPILLGLRFYTRRVQGARIGIDDWLLIPALLCGIGCAIAVIIGVGIHAFAYPSPPAGTLENAENYTVDEKLQVAFYLLQILCIGLVKLSFLFFFRRIFVTQKTTVYNWTSIALIVIITLWTVMFAAMFLAGCGGHFDAHWISPTVFKQYCVYDLPTLEGLAISDFLTDLIVLSFPIFPVVRLHTSITRKLAILAVFAIALAALVASILRLVFVNTVINGDKTELSKNSHNNLLATQAIYWSMVQCVLAFVACCLPTYHALLASAPMKALQTGFQSIVSKGSSNSLRRNGITLEDRQERNIDPSVGQNLANTGGQNETTIISLSDYGKHVRNSELEYGFIRVENTVQQESHKV